MNKSDRFTSAAPLALAMALVLPGGCTLGDSSDADPSPYETAELNVASSVGVADGATHVEVTVTGPIGAKLTLVVSGGADFRVPDEGKVKERTVFLTVGEDGQGVATAHVVSAVVGSVSVSFKPDPLRTPRQIDFLPVHMAAGPGVETELLPGLVEHQVCIALNSAAGMVSATNLVGTEPDGSTIDAEATVSASAPAGGDCPSVAVDAVGWVGYASFTWRSRTGAATVDLNYQSVGLGGAAGDTLATAKVDLRGQAFAGYDLSAATPVASVDFVSVELTARYRAVGVLPASPAGAVTVDQRFIPAPGPGFLGSSSGGTDDTPRTDAQGAVSMFFDSSVSGTYAWFVTLSGGDVAHVGDLVIP